MFSWINFSLPASGQEFLPWSPLLLRFNLTSNQGLQYPVPDPHTPSSPGSPHWLQPHQPPFSSLVLPGSSLHLDAFPAPPTPGKFLLDHQGSAKPRLLQGLPWPFSDHIRIGDMQSRLQAPSIRHPSTDWTLVHLCDLRLPGELSQITG